MFFKSPSIVARRVAEIIEIKTKRAQEEYDTICEEADRETEQKIIDLQEENVQKKNIVLDELVSNIVKL